MSFSISYNSGYGMRGIAMLMIILAHSLNEYGVFSSVLCRALLIPDYGILGCGLFFLLSGYGLGHSLEKHKDNLSWGYIGQRLKKLFKPLLIAFVLMTLVLYGQRCFGIENELDFKNLLTLSFPDGTDLWFFKIILFDYLVLFALYKLFKPNKPYYKLYILLSLTLLHLLLLGLLWGGGFTRYWFVSNLCFVVGLGIVYRPQIFEKYRTPIVGFSSLVLIAFALLSFYQKYFIPGEIIGIIAFSLLCCYLAQGIKTWHNSLIFIGKNSLSYYLFSIPVMTFVPHTHFHWSLYFLLTFSLTTLLVLVELQINRRSS